MRSSSTRLSASRCRSVSGAPTRRAQVARHVAERRDAERLRQQLELGMRVDRARPCRATGAMSSAIIRAIAGRACLPQREPDLQRAEPARVLRPVVDVVRRLLVEVVVRRMIRERVAQPLGCRAPARTPPRAARTATCADRPPRSRPRSSRAGRPARRARRRRSRRTRRRRETTRRARGRRGDLRAADRPRRCSPSRPCRRPRTGASPAGDVRVDLRAQRSHVHPQTVVGRNPSDRGGAKAREIGGLLIHVCVSAEP